MTAAQNFAPHLQEELEPPPLLKVSFFAFCIFNLAFYSRFFEWQLSWLHVPLITSSIALLGAAMEGRLVAVFRSKIGICMALLTVLYTVNIPFSSWMRGSLQVLMDDWLKAFMAFTIAGALVFNVRQCRVALHSIGWGSGMAGVLVNWKGQVVNGRLVLGRGTLGNSNEIAFDLLMGLPFMLLMLQDARGNKGKKFLVLCLMASNLLGMLRSGSRGGLIGLAVFAVLIFLRSSMAGKIGMIFAALLLLAVGVTVLPSSLKSRYAMFLQSTADEPDVSGVVSSTQARRQLLEKSLKVSLQHPIFGVGIGQFGSYMAGIEKAQGIHSGWQGTHNTYTQISSEAGTPALIVFVCMIAFSVRGVQGLSKRAKRLPLPRERVKEIIDVSFSVSSTVIVYAVCVCFDYIAYSAILPVLAGFAAALMRCGNVELDRMEHEPATPPSSQQIVNLYPVRPPRPLRQATF
jgi:O-Antigen ligase